MPGVGVFPGSFNPPTIAHLAIAEAARTQGALSRVDLAVSRRALGKEDPDGPTFDDRLTVLEAVASSRPWLAVVVSDARLIADVAQGYDAVIVGADKWAQIVDPLWYGGSEIARDAALARLPQVLVAIRPPLFPSPSPHLRPLSLDAAYAEVSSTGVRSGGHREWMAPEAAGFDAETGAWSDPARYEQWQRVPGVGGHDRRGLSRDERLKGAQGALDHRGEG